MFTISGTLLDGREATVEWHEPGEPFWRGPFRVGGDPDLVWQALIHVAERRTFAATPTGPFYEADLDDPEAALVQLTSYFRDGYRLGGDPPALDVALPLDGAIY